MDHRSPRVCLGRDCASRRTRERLAHEAVRPSLHETCIAPRARGRTRFLSFQGIHYTYNIAFDLLKKNKRRGMTTTIIFDFKTILIKIE
jgi:hypothetical protein